MILNLWTNFEFSSLWNYYFILYALNCKKIKLMVAKWGVNNHIIPLATLPTDYSPPWVLFLIKYNSEVNLVDTFFDIFGHLFHLVWIVPWWYGFWFGDCFMKFKPCDTFIYIYIYIYILRAKLYDTTFSQ